jgi:hypothetical protein
MLNWYKLLCLWHTAYKFPVLNRTTRLQSDLTVFSYIGRVSGYYFEGFSLETKLWQAKFSACVVWNHLLKNSSYIYKCVQDHNRKINLLQSHAKRLRYRQGRSQDFRSGGGQQKPRWGQAASDLRRKVRARHSVQCWVKLIVDTCDFSTFRFDMRILKQCTFRLRWLHTLFIIGGLVPNLEFSRENVKNICKNKYNN